MLPARSQRIDIFLLVLSGQDNRSLPVSIDSKSTGAIIVVEVKPP